MEKSFPFNAILVDGQPDRAYSAEDFAAERAAYVSNGVTSEDSLAVAAGAAGGMTVDVSAGMAVIDGYTYRNTTPLTLTLPAADGVYPRLDLVVLRLDLDAREMRCAISAGIPSANPVAPALADNGSVHEIPLAQIDVAAGETLIESTMLTDLRPRASYILNTMDVEAVLEEYKRAITNHFSTEDAAAMAQAAAVLRTDGGSRQVLCGDGIYRDATSITNGRVELCRFTQSGTFRPADYPTADGRYDIVLQGGGGSGASTQQSGTDVAYGGSAGGYLSLSGITLIPEKAYPVTVGKGGAAITSGVNTSTPGNDGGATAFWNYSVSGGAGGPLNGDPVPVTVCGFTPETGTASAYGKGGDSHFGIGGRNGRTGYGDELTPYEERHWEALAGGLGAGGGSLERYGNWVNRSGAGGDGIVIIYGIPA